MPLLLKFLGCAGLFSLWIVGTREAQTTGDRAAIDDPQSEIGLLSPS